MCLSILVFLFLITDSSFAANIVLEVDGVGKFTIAQLKKKFPVKEVTLENPVSHQTVTYEGVLVSDVLGPALKNTDTEVVMTCTDGYQPVADGETLDKFQFMFAWGEKGNPKIWTLLNSHGAMVSPGPFYVVGMNPESYQIYPWPYQVNKVKLISLPQEYAKAFPVEAKKGSGVYRGFKIFVRKCLSCHSVNGQGGSVGPELNLPKNVTEYWKKDQIKEFIKDPSSFRFNTKMMTYSDLTVENIDELVEYLEHMKDHKLASPENK